MTTTTEKIPHESTWIDKVNSQKVPPVCYIVDVEKIVDTMLGMLTAFKKIYSNTAIGYSFKTNSTPYICEALINHGALAEVVSPKEFFTATKLTKYNNIIYNGVIPDVYGKCQIASNGGIVNIDNYQELIALESQAKRLNEVLKIGLRLNFDIGAGYVSRFGIEYEGEEYNKILEHVENSKFVTINGIHCHFHGGRGLEYWERRADKMIEIGKKLDVDYIDLGGNMYGDMDERLKAQFDDDIPTFEDYANVVASRFKDAFPDKKPLLIIEAGTPIVANGVSLLTRVVSTKTIQGKSLATLNGSIYNLGFISKTRTVPIDIVHTNELIPEGRKHDLYGYTCTEGDLMYEGYEGPLSVGDIVLFRNVGAYAVDMCSDFIKSPPPVIGYVEQIGFFELTNA